MSLILFLKFYLESSSYINKKKKFKQEIRFILTYFCNNHIEFLIITLLHNFSNKIIINIIFILFITLLFSLHSLIHIQTIIIFYINLYHSLYHSSLFNCIQHQL